MKNIITGIFIALSALQTQAQTLAEANRTFVVNHLTFIYVDNPTQAPGDRTRLPVINKTDIANNRDIDSPLWTNADNRGLKALLIRLLRPSANGGDERLQRIARNILCITQKNVYVYLFHDNSGAAPHADWNSDNGGIYCVSTNNASWPCARAFFENPRYAGEMGLGAVYTNPSDTAALIERLGTFLHELTHTQILHYPDPLPTGVSMYGGDDSHYLDEVLPSRNTAFNEGIANAFKYRYIFQGWKNMTTWFNNNDSLFIDDLPNCTGHATIPRHCLQARLAQIGVDSTNACDMANAHCYRIRSIPAEIMMYNENTCANMLYQYMTQFDYGEVRFVRDIRMAAPYMRGANQFTFASLFKVMVRTSLNYSNRPNNPAGETTHGQHMPMALLDYYTGYKLENKAALESILGTRWLDTDTDILGYFPRHRPTFLGYRANPTTWSERYIDRFAIEHTNVRSEGQQLRN
jgi:hypothetical protein